MPSNQTPTSIPADYKPTLPPTDLPPTLPAGYGPQAGPEIVEKRPYLDLYQQMAGTPPMIVQMPFGPEPLPNPVSPITTTLHNETIEIKLDTNDLTQAKIFSNPHGESVIPDPNFFLPAMVTTDVDNNDLMTAQVFHSHDIARKPLTPAIIASSAPQPTPTAEIDALVQKVKIASSTNKTDNTLDDLNKKIAATEAEKKQFQEQAQKAQEELVVSASNHNAGRTLPRTPSRIETLEQTHSGLLDSLQKLSQENKKLTEQYITQTTPTKPTQPQPSSVTPPATNLHKDIIMVVDEVAKNSRRHFHQSNVVVNSTNVTPPPAPALNGFSLTPPASTSTTPPVISAKPQKKRNNLPTSPAASLTEAQQQRNNLKPVTPSSQPAPTTTITVPTLTIPAKYLEKSGRQGADEKDWTAYENDETEPTRSGDDLQEFLNNIEKPKETIVSIPTKHEMVPIISPQFMGNMKEEMDARRTNIADSGIFNKDKTDNLWDSVPVTTPPSRTEDL